MQIFLQSIKGNVMQLKGKSEGRRQGGLDGGGRGRLEGKRGDEQGLWGG